jgi:DNA-directed RNA polymerase subunit beta
VTANSNTSERYSISQETGRRSYSRIASNFAMPNLLAVQLESYNDFLQVGRPVETREDKGLESVFQSIFPITSTREHLTLEYLYYMTGEPKYTVEECQERGLSFSVPLKVNMRLIVKEQDADTNEWRQKEIVEHPVYLGELPKITDKGTFIINGAERVIVSQLHRSPGVFFSDETHPNGTRLFNSRIIPYRGSWVEFSTDINDIMYIHIDRKRKQPVTIILRALGFETDESILELFHKLEVVKIPKSATTKRAGEMIGRIVASDVYLPDAEEPLFEVGDVLTEDNVGQLIDAAVVKVMLIGAGEVSTNEPSLMLNTLAKDPTSDKAEALRRVYNILRPGDPPNESAAKSLFERLFFNDKKYDLAEVGRHKLNMRLGLDIPLETRTLTPSDFLAIIQTMINLRLGREGTDDIDHFGNRRVRSVGELLSKQFSVGLSRMARIVKERMNLSDKDNLTPQDLVNARTVSAVIQSFFGSSQLSQFMDQTNPLSELTHKRRLSALGPGGLHRDRAGFEVRDVHYTHYGRMCPIETPEGPNIGLISSLSTLARINDYGFIETPYRKVRKGVVSDETDYLAADVEDQFTIAQANAPLQVDGKFVNDRVLARQRGEFPLADNKIVDYMDVSPKQIVSAAASLIPFLEHDDANRALMGCNMQRQAVPLLKTESPLVGTGMEHKVAVDSGAVVVALDDGEVQSVQADSIVIRYDNLEDDETGDFFCVQGIIEHKLQKFRRSNQDTCINQRPIVKFGERVVKGQVIADGPSTRRGELALGLNMLVAFMPWGGYNYEDAILISERVVKEDLLTSLHIEQFELQVRDTKRGVEEITREIPNVGEDALKNLDEEGVIYIGAPVKAGDILVGKVTPKGETELSPEERLLRAIFGEKAGDVKDASLKAPPGMDGIILDVRVFSRQDRTERSKKFEKQSIDRLGRKKRQLVVQVKDIRDNRLRRLFVGQTARKLLDPDTGETLMRSGTKMSEKALAEFDFDRVHWGLQLVADDSMDGRIRNVFDSATRELEKLEVQYLKEVERVQRGDELPPGVVKLVKVYVARKRKLQVGDKMAGRHGNKGVVARILPEEDMPYLDDGTPVDIVLNPLGVPSRMNLGQLMETHLGLAAKRLGYKVETPVFDGASWEDITDALEEADLPTSGKARLFDGRTGEELDNEVTVGEIYMLKLSHLVDDKIHARSIGPYSLVTQQPLGGKAQFGGQRFGEMEVWALEAYGAANALQEMLTVKSDDVVGRSKVYEAIVKGENPPAPGIPESFNVLMKELQALCLDVQLETAN